MAIHLDKSKHIIRGLRFVVHMHLCDFPIYPKGTLQLISSDGGKVGHKELVHVAGEGFGFSHFLM